jgi:MFS family permease
MKNFSPSSRAWVAWLVATSFYAFQYILRVSPSIMLEDIRLKFEVDASQFGIFSGAYYIGYPLIHLPLGILLDRVGPRLVVFLSIFLAISGLLPLIYSDSWVFAIIGRFLLGAGSSAAILGVFKVIRLNFPAYKFATYLGISVTIGLLGALYGGYPIHEFTIKYGWVSVLNMLFFAGVILAFLAFVTLPSHKEVKQPSKGWVVRDLKYIVSTRHVVTTALFGALMVGPLEGFADVWGTSFLTHVYNLDRGTAALLPSLIFLGMCVGSPLLAYWGEKTNQFQRIINFAALGMAISFSLLLAFKLHVVILSTLFFIIGVLCAYQVLIIHVNSLKVSSEHAGVVTAFTNMVIMSFGYVFHYGIGRLMKLFWDGRCESGIATYSSAAYRMGLSIIPIALLIAFFGFQIIAPSRLSKKYKN